MQWDASRGGPFDEFIESAAIRDEIQPTDLVKILKPR